MFYFNADFSQRLLAAQPTNFEKCYFTGEKMLNQFRDSQKSLVNSTVPL